VEKEKTEKEIVEKSAKSEVYRMSLGCGYCVPRGQPHSDMIQPDHPGDACACGNS